MLILISTLNFFMTNKGTVCLHGELLPTVHTFLDFRPLKNHYSRFFKSLIFVLYF